MTGKQMTWIWSGCIALLLYATACQNKAATARDRKHHQVEVARAGALLYVDEIDPKQMIREEGGSTGSRFVAYKVGFYDSTLTVDKEVLEAAGNYYQYRMERDWKLLLQGDSLSPVLYHPVTTLARQVNESIVVFEMPVDKQVDTLVYTDARGAWGTQIFDCKKLNH